MPGLLGHKSCRLALAVILVLAFSLVKPFGAQAASVTNFSDALSTIQQSVAANHTITFTTADDWSSTETLSIDLPDTFTTTGFANNEPEDYDLTDDAVEQVLVANGGCSGTALEIEITTVNTSTNTFTFTRCTGDATIASGSVVVIEIGTNATTGSAGNDQITNQTAVQNNSDAIVTLAGNFGGSGTLALEIIANNTFSLSATVDPQITCAIDNTSGTFGTFTIGTIATASNSPTWTISTNASNGYSLTIHSLGNTTNAGLYSASAGYVIKSADSAEASSADLSTSDIIGYGLQGTKTNGGAGSATTSISSPYTASGNNVGRLQLTNQPLASAAGAVSNATITSTFKAVVSGLVPAGSYVDTATYVCTGIY